jgi:hypothetical protein
MSIKQLSDYAEMEACKSDVAAMRDHYKKEWSKSKDMKNGQMLLNIIRLRMNMVRTEIQSCARTGTPPTVGYFED